MLSSRRVKSFGRRAIGALAVTIGLLGPSAGSAAVAVTAAKSAAVTSAVAEEPSFSNPLVCEWNVECSQAGVTAVVWSADPFLINAKLKSRFNASLRVEVLQVVGPASVAVVQASATTVQDGKAVVTAVVTGTGTIRFRTWVGAADSMDLQPAGSYFTVVHAESINK